MRDCAALLGGLGSAVAEATQGADAVEIVRL